MVAGDFNGDGIDDLAVSNGSNIQIFLGASDGTLGSPTIYPSVSASGFGAMVTGDFRGNGMLDLAVSGDATIFMLLGNGDGTFQTPVAYSEPGGLGGLVAGKFNNDGFLDLAGIGNNGLGLVLGNGDGTLQNGIVNIGGGTLALQALYAGFFDNAGTPNLGLLAINNYGGPSDSGEIADAVTFISNGNATFQAPVTDMLAENFGGQFAVTGFQQQTAIPISSLWLHILISMTRLGSIRM